MRRLVAFLLVLAAFWLPAQGAGRSFIWKATSASGATGFLVGSVHLLSADFYPLAPIFDQSFAQSDLLVEELDMGEMLAPEAQMRMLTRGLLPAGQTLDQVLSPKTYAGVQSATSGLGLPIEPLKQFKPWMLAITLQSLAWQKAGFDAQLGLDKHFYDLATASGKEIRGLETLDFQLSRFDDMSPAVQDRMLAETLQEIATSAETFRTLANAWKAGDVEAIERQVAQDLKDEPEMYKRLLVDRNRTWLPRIEALLARRTPAFIVVGAAHLVGTDGLLRMLAAKGYQIAQL